MIITRPHGAIAGFHFDQPVAGLDVLTHCGDEICGPLHHIGPHYHENFEFCYVRQGCATWHMDRMIGRGAKPEFSTLRPASTQRRIGQRLVRQESGQLLVALPGQWHDLAEPHGRYRILYAGVNLEQVGRQGRKLARQLIDRRINLIPHALNIEPILSSMVHQVTAQPAMGLIVVKNLLRTLVAMVSQLTIADPERPGQKPFHIHSYPVEAALSLMRQRLDRPLTIAELGDVANYSPAHFARMFKKEVGISPAAFHFGLRLQAARTELGQHDLSITQVAMMFGFSSSQHFSRSFRAAFEQTPKQWRRQVQQGQTT